MNSVRTLRRKGTDGLTPGLRTETIPIYLFNDYFGVDTYSLKVMNDIAF